MKRIILILLASIGLVSICGCDSSANQVKNGTLRQYPDVTVGAAFDSSFDNAKWDTLTDKGRKIVRFTGRITQATHDAAAKRAIFDESLIVQNYKSGEFNKRITPYEEKLTRLEEANAKEIGAIRAARYKVKDKYEKLDSEEQPAVNNYIYEKTPENKKIVDEIKRRKELLEKENTALQGKLDLYDQKRQQLIAEKDTAIQKILKDLFEDFKRDSYWPAGQYVEFSFIVYPDGKRFEIDSFSNESWAKLRLSLESVLNVIFAKQ